MRYVFLNSKKIEGDSLKLILPTEFKDLFDNDENFYDEDINTNKKIVRIYDKNEILIAKSIQTMNKNKGKMRYFGVKNHREHLSEEYLKHEKEVEKRKASYNKR